MSEIIWQSVAIGIIGFILGFWLCATVANAVTDDRIKAGVFENDGVGYKVERLAQ